MVILKSGAKVVKKNKVAHFLCFCVILTEKDKKERTLENVLSQQDNEKESTILVRQQQEPFRLRWWCIC